jgi:peptidoglycan-associated lipoprotein
MRFSIASKILAGFAGMLLLAACESTPETGGETTGSGGGGTTTAATTPSGPAAGSVEEFQQTVGDRVFFDFDKYDLKPEARAQLEQQAAWLKSYPQYSITVEGHADERGTREYNLALGERRATSVKNYLVALGLDPNRVTTISYGKERPEVLGSNEAAWAQNRRAVTTLQ